MLPESAPISYKGTRNAGILMIHGISSSPYEMSYVAKRFSEAGFHIECPLLPGHGTTWKDLAKAKYTDWMNEIEKSLFLLSKKVSQIFVFGLSMGGALTLALAESHPEISGIIIVNHALIIKNPFFKFLSIIRFFLPYVKKRSPLKGRRSVKDKTIPLYLYDRLPVNALYELSKLLKLVKYNLPKIHQPVLIFKSKEDSLPIESVENTYNGIQSRQKEVIWLSNSWHIATLDFDKDKIAAMSLEFLLQLLL